jgi:protease IV
MKEYFIWLLKLVTIFLLIFIIAPLALVTVSKVAATGGGDSATGKNTVAVVELKGEIIDSRDIVEKLFKQVANPKIKGVVLRIDSPGGAVGPSQDIYNAVNTLKTKKPIIASMGSLAASGGLYSAVAASKIFSQPGTLTGSIGVIIQVPNFTKLASTVGVSMITVKSGKLKDVANPFRDMTPEEQAYLESTIGGVHSDFINAVAVSRNIPREEVLKFADGRILTGTQAKELKIVDQFGGVYEAALEVFNLLGSPLKEGEVPELFYPEDKFSKLREFLETFTRIPAILSRGIKVMYVMN